MVIGRSAELQHLVHCLDELPLRGGFAMCLTGEAGIGKSTLLSEIRTIVRQRDMSLASIVSHDERWQPAYAPWQEVLNQLDLPALPEVAAEDRDIAAWEFRFRISQALLETLHTATREHPVVLVFDDLQWLDPASRELLLHIVRHLDSMRVGLFLGWRTPVIDPEFTAFAANLYRDPASRWLELDGLAEDAVGAIMQDFGWQAAQAEIRNLTARTNGNPFYVTEIARLEQEAATIGSRAAPAELPESIRSVVQMRFSSLPEPTRHLVRVASVFPREFSFSLLRDITGDDEDAMLDAIDQALATDFLRPVEQHPEHYRFAHDIVREAIVSTWSPSRLARWHRKAAEVLETSHAGRTSMVAGDLAMHYFASRSLAGAERGIPFAMDAAEQATQVFDYAQAASMLDVAVALAVNEPAPVRMDIAWRHALALAESLQVDAAARAAERAIDLLHEAQAAPEVTADVCWQLAHTMNAIGADAAIRQRLQDEGLRALGARRDLQWARLRLLADPSEVMPNDVLFAARWVGFDPEARAIAESSDNETDQVQTVESFDPRTPAQTRILIARARSWQQPRSTLRGLTAAANDLTYRHGEFRLAMTIWQEILALARRIGTIPWQANALNQLVLLHITLGEFPQVGAVKREADATNALLGPATDADVLSMERDFALAHYLDGDWPGQSAYWLQFVAATPHGLEAQLAAPLYAAMATTACAQAGVAVDRVTRLLDELAIIATEPGIQQVNGVVGWAAGAVFRFGLRDRAATWDRLAAGLIDAGAGDYPQTSLHLSRARMLALQGDAQAAPMFDQAREHLARQQQWPLLGIACYEQAVAPATGAGQRRILLDQARELFSRLHMTYWHERASQAIQPGTAGDTGHAAGASPVSRRELEVLRLLAQGRLDRQIAEELFISERTVHAHVRNMLQKTDCDNRLQLANWAREMHLFEHEPADPASTTH